MAELSGLQAALGDRYTIERELGRGGTATVYLAQDVKHSRPVAIKVLAPELALAVRTERFLREIQIAARLQHPHILPLHDSGQAAGQLYYVMPYVAGETLKDRLAREGPLPLDDAVRITQQVASALEYAHEQGVVHRDIKPGNILLSAGMAVVADFGIARAISVAESQGVTESGIAVGTPAYMSPEQAGGGADLDGRTDIYSLGCVLYEMLVGTPPFRGATAQALIAQHLVDRPPAVRRSRTNVPVGVERILDRALAKGPAERFRTARELSAALAAPDTVPARRWSRRTQVRVAVGAGLAIATVGGAWRLVRSQSLALDANKIVVFPLVERGVTKEDEGVGERVALMIGSALEHTEPLKWIDGWTWLGADERRDITHLTPEAARNIARDRRARYYIDGSLILTADSTTVILRLNDAAGDSLISQASATGAASKAPAAQLGLDGVTELLPRVMEPGRRVDLSALAARRPAAVASWLQGEREYRRSRFGSALGFYKRAVTADSALAVAALKGAQAASWDNLDSDAVNLIRIAIAHPEGLPSKHRHFAIGLRGYLAGQGDTAVKQLSRALREDPDWAEAHMAMGEAYYHLIPTASAPLDSLAEASFRRAVSLDTGFAPPLYHLIEIAIREGRLAEAVKFLERFDRFEPDSGRRRQLSLMVSCVGGSEASRVWTHEAQVAPMDVLQAARSLAVGARQPACAEEGLRSLLALPEERPFSYHWGALRVLNGLMVSEERYAELAFLLDSLVKRGMTSALALYFLDALAGAPFDQQASATDSALRKQFGDGLAGVSVRGRWLIASWYARHGDVAGVARVRSTLLSDSAAALLPISEGLAGHLALERGDTSEAIRDFTSLAMPAPREALEWGLFEPLAVERFALAEVALRQGRPADAWALASVFDHPSPVAYLPFVASSLRIRLQAARALHRSEDARVCERRLQRLTHPSSLSSTLGKRKERT